MSEPSHPTSGGAPVFWKEIYGFVAIGLLGAILALWLVPPKARRYWSLIEHEARLEVRNRTLREKVLELEEAIESLQRDPFFREAVLRERLGIKRRSEEWLRSRGTTPEKSSRQPPRG